MATAPIGTSHSVVANASVSPATPATRTHRSAATRTGRGHPGRGEARWSEPLSRVDAANAVVEVVRVVHADLEAEPHERGGGEPPRDRVPGRRRTHDARGEAPGR